MNKPEGKKQLFAITELKGITLERGKLPFELFKSDVSITLLLL